MYIVYRRCWWYITVCILLSPDIYIFNKIRLTEVKEDCIFMNQKWSFKNKYKPLTKHRCMPKYGLLLHIHNVKTQNNINANGMSSQWSAILDKYHVGSYNCCKISRASLYVGTFSADISIPIVQAQGEWCNHVRLQISTDSEVHRY